MNGLLHGKLKSLPWELQTEAQMFSGKEGVRLAAGGGFPERRILAGSAATQKLWRAVWREMAALIRSSSVAFSPLQGLGKGRHTWFASQFYLPTLTESLQNLLSPRQTLFSIPLLNVLHWNSLGPIFFHWLGVWDWHFPGPSNKLILVLHLHAPPELPCTMRKFSQVQTKHHTVVHLGHQRMSKSC